MTEYQGLMTRFPLDFSNGSTNSIEFFKCIQGMNPEQQADYDELILYKWKKIKIWSVIQLTFYVISAYRFNTWTYYYNSSVETDQNKNDDDFTFGEFFAIILGFVGILPNLAIMIVEIISSCVVKDYFDSVYNWFDLIVLPGTFFFSFVNIMTDSKDQSKFMNILNFVLSTLMNIRTITYFRVFDSFRYLIEMIINIYRDIRTFLVVILFYVLTYAMGLRAIDQINSGKGKPYSDYIKVGLELAFGNWDNIPEEWNDWNWMLFLGYNITFTIILLNLIIAIVSKTFDEYYETQSVVDRRVKLELILETDQLFRPFSIF